VAVADTSREWSSFFSTQVQINEVLVVPDIVTDGMEECHQIHDYEQAHINATGLTPGLTLCSHT
jgi:hypothetical protein